MIRFNIVPLSWCGRAVVVLLIAAASLTAVSAQPAAGRSERVMQTEPFYRLSQVDMAAVKIDAVVKFYESVFGAKFTVIDAGSFKMYTGELFGIRTVIAPNSIAGVNAEQSRHQFELVTNDMDGAMARAKAAGGTIRDESPGDGKGPRTVTLVDPDGNTIVLHEAQAK